VRLQHGPSGGPERQRTNRIEERRTQVGYLTRRTSQTRRWARSFEAATALVRDGAVIARRNRCRELSGQLSKKPRGSEVLGSAGSARRARNGSRRRCHAAAERQLRPGWERSCRRPDHR